MSHCPTCMCRIERTCDKCGRTFVPRRRDQRYDSGKCARAAASAAYRQRQVLKAVR